MGHREEARFIYWQSLVLPNWPASMIYYLRLLAAIAEANYAEAYWDAVAVSEWWISTLEAVTNR